MDVTGMAESGVRAAMQDLRRHLRKRLAKVLTAGGGGEPLVEDRQGWKLDLSPIMFGLQSLGSTSRPDKDTLNEPFVAMLKSATRPEQPPQRSVLRLEDLLSILTHDPKVGVLFVVGSGTSLGSAGQPGYVCDAFDIPEVTRRLVSECLRRHPAASPISVRLAYDWQVENFADGTLGQWNIVTVGSSAVNSVTGGVFDSYGENCLIPRFVAGNAIEAHGLDGKRVVFRENTGTGVGLLALVVNPLRRARVIVVCAGVDGTGTAAALRCMSLYLGIRPGELGGDANGTVPKERRYDHELPVRIVRGIPLLPSWDRRTRYGGRVEAWPVGAVQFVEEHGRTPRGSTEPLEDGLGALLARGAVLIEDVTTIHENDGSG